MMETARILENGKNHSVCLPEKFRFNVDEVVVQQHGEAVLLVPKESLWQTFMEGLDRFTNDVFEDRRSQGEQEERETLRHICWIQTSAFML